jgi:hypothetical protein
VKHDPWELVGEAIERMQRNGDVMRADRLKQVMQQIDPSFDEGDLGMAKFSRFVTEAANKGLLTLTKLENGQLEVTPAGDKANLPAPATADASRATAEPKLGERPRRGRRGGRGRTRETSSAAKPASEATHTAPAPVAAAAPEEPGTSGLRLTREDAFNLVRRAVEAVASRGKTPRATEVRTAARELLGRDSESLSERNFTRILQDAHAADLIDLRKRGNDYEVELASAVAPVTEQLAAASPPPPAQTPKQTAGRAGSVPRGRGTIGAKRGEIPADLFSVGVVPSWGEAATPSPEPAAEPEAEVEAQAEAEAEAPSERKRPSRPRRPRKTAAVGEDGKPVARRSPRKPRTAADEQA